MALRDPLPMGLGSISRGDSQPKFNPMQVNQVFNECLQKEFRFQGPVQRRPYRIDLPTLQSQQVTKKANQRSKIAVREQLSKSCNSPRMIRDLQRELGKEGVTPTMGTPDTTSQAATLCYKSVKQHLKEDKLSTADPGSASIQKTLQLQKMLPPERRRLPETMAQEVGWLASAGYAPKRGGCKAGVGMPRSQSLPGGSMAFEDELAGQEIPEASKEAQDRPTFWWKPRRPCPETEYVRLYYETLQSNPFSNAGMFPDANDKKG